MQKHTHEEIWNKQADIIDAVYKKLTFEEYNKVNKALSLLSEYFMGPEDELCKCRINVLLRTHRERSLEKCAKCGKTI